MPARKRTAPSTSSTTKTSASSALPKRSALARSAGITALQESSISEAFNLFSLPCQSPGIPADFRHETSHGVIRREDVRRVLVSLGVPPSGKSELLSFLETLDPTETGYATYEPFVALAALKLRDKGDEEVEDGDAEGLDVEDREVDRAFRLFTAGGQGFITLPVLQRVARELKEDVDDDVLRGMLEEAGGPRVDRDMFADVMRRAGVF